MNFTEQRRRFLDWVRRQVIGPASEDPDFELRGIKPVGRFPSGVLFPIVRGEDGLDAVDEESEDEALTQPGQEAKDEVESAQKRRRYVPPSAAGFSFFVSGEQIRLAIEATAACYENLEKRDEQGRFTEDRWGRRELKCSDQELDRLIVSAPDSGTPGQIRKFKVFRNEKADTEKAGIDIRWRPRASGWLVTVSLFNAAELEDGLPQSKHVEQLNCEALFEVSLRCRIESGTVGDYPRVDLELLSDEERELELQYRNRNIFAVGHGAAADWSVGDDGSVTEIRIEFMPTAEVPGVTADVAGEDNRIFEFDRLAGMATEAGSVLEDLGGFVDGYAEWVCERAQEAKTLSDREAAGRILARIETAIGRMREGVERLRSDDAAAKAFSLANRAMSDQMRQSLALQGREAPILRWRPFQLAFLLATLESAINEDSEFRDVVDLIWFPTGGGKTEAYLGLIAFLIVWRRLKFPDTGGGTVALMRYTLRLLTAQQFDRATLLICALELLRRRHPEIGDEPITLGMWVGTATSPNSFGRAHECLQVARDSGRGAPAHLVVRKCPWCGTPFDPAKNYRSSPNRFEFLCRNPDCEFGGDGSVILPCNVVDEALYRKPPSLLIATIDKFAQLPWNDKPGEFLGGKRRRPPELVIQDELHLISGALGSVAGLYEAGLESAMVHRGVRPKYVASTATIRMASEQVRRLYGKEVAVFPPPGLDCDDSYFARTVPVEEKPGRLYVGYFAPALDRRRCMAPLAGALMAAPELVFPEGMEDRDAYLDAWWTLVVYHGSLKGVGISHNAFGMEAENLIGRLESEAREFAKKRGDENDRIELERTRRRAVRQLTSQSGAEKNAETFADLERRHGEADCLDAVLATNMISVGLDVSRLALMLVNGQPLTTGEYIQSSSRVGRGEVPGLVFANYYRDQARSLSHFENFRAYHESFYRFVEPSSVTPYTRQARKRAMHAALVIAIRHSGIGYAANDMAGSFNKNEERIRKVLSALEKRCLDACDDDANALSESLKSLADKWHDEAERARKQKRQLCYRQASGTSNADRLLHNHGDRIEGLWATLQSMRNVEKTALLKKS